MALVLIAFAINVGEAQQPRAYAVTGDTAGAHDPSIIRAGSHYHVFTTGKAPEGGQLAIRCSEDLLAWRACGQVFEALPSWIKERSPGTRDLWAPDISYEHGVYRLYYAYSLFGKNTSGIALATNVTLDPASPQYLWKDKGLILESKAADDFNAIDPNYIEDNKHHAWLAFGSFWTGIKMRALDPDTGKLLTSDPKTYSLASRSRPVGDKIAPAGLPANSQAIEAPFLVRHGRYYYLFVSYDLCCRGVKSTYRTMVGRSRDVTGPYVDREGTHMLQGGATPVLAANRTWLGPGGQSVWLQRHGPDLLVYHAYDHVTGKPALQVSTIHWKKGWPEAALREP